MVYKKGVWEFGIKGGLSYAKRERGVNGIHTTVKRVIEKRVIK